MGALGPRAVTARDGLAIARIVKVNHAGEYGAIRIYTAQIAVAARLCPDAVPALSRMLAHEREHCAAFQAAMPARDARPCRIMKLWSCGGWLLGFLMALLGRQGIWACTAAVEAAVHRHLDDQLRFLAERDRQLHQVIASIREEELSHLQHAENNLRSPEPLLRCLRLAISHMTDALIFLSTSADSRRMTRDLRAARSRA
ncbi:MAG: demethoxyubiquinone hydroxylase family protein [Beijerinckiaceae bacterium]